MPQPKAVVKPEDYDTYRICLPMKAVFGQRRKKFILSELEKRHPLFGARNCFDTKLSFADRKVFADVTVMDSVVLSRYRHLFPRRLLQIRRSFVFVPQYIKALPFAAALVLAAVFFVFLCNKKNLAQSTAFDTTSVVNENIFSPAAENANVDFQKFPDAFEIISAIEKSNGSLSAFSWRDDSSLQTFQMDVVNCYPEKIFPAEKLAFSPVAYNENVPNFSVSFSSPSDAANKNYASDLSFLKNAETADAFRANMRRAPFMLVSETHEPFEIAFSSAEKNISECVSFLCRLEEEFSLRVSAFSFLFAQSGWSGKAAFQHIAQPEPQQSAQLQLQQQQENAQPQINEKKIMQAAIPLLERFEKSIKANAASNNLQTQVSGEPSPQIVSPKQKIGETKRADGTVRTYYKLPDGKISVEEEE